MILSIVISCYNKESEIKRTLDSVTSQNLDECEVIVLNDASTDNSWKEIQNWYANQHKVNRIRIRNSYRNRGISRIRNIGIKLSKGEYIHFLDGDDCFQPEYIASLVAILKQEQPDIISIQGQWRNSGKIRPQTGVYRKTIVETATPRIHLVREPLRMMEQYLALGGSQVTFRKSIIRKSRFQPKETMFEDFGFYFQWISERTKWYYWENIQVIYDDQPQESLSRKRRINAEINMPIAISMAPTQKIQKYLIGVMLYSIVSRYDLKYIHQFMKANGSIVFDGLFTKHGIFAYLLLIKRNLKNIISQVIFIGHL